MDQSESFDLGLHTPREWRFETSHQEHGLNEDDVNDQIQFGSTSMFYTSI